MSPQHRRDHNEDQTDEADAPAVGIAGAQEPPDEAGEPTQYSKDGATQGRSYGSPQDDK